MLHRGCWAGGQCEGAWAAPAGRRREPCLQCRERGGGVCKTCGVICFVCVRESELRGMYYASLGFLSESLGRACGGRTCCTNDFRDGRRNSVGANFSYGRKLVPARRACCAEPTWEPASPWEWDGAPRPRWWPLALVSRLVLGATGAWQVSSSPICSLQHLCLLSQCFPCPVFEKVQFRGGLM